ncbi:MAG: methylated-DNA--[protein]-cysteine S-methyltransferase [Xanthomonadales bacterium]|jgi:AraC family transcriptional regulator of adaptative response/methylated-DNA-[protein]-cysteine methyltransferase|nr:methylated-DNA--[protein]-cysteine S-methyltransferase [Xanthomonadales bacterium]
MESHYDMIADALRYLVNHQAEQPDLHRLARHLGHSEGHVQRTFQAYAGLSPKQFVRMLTREKALERLAEGANVLEASLDSGLSGPGRLHDLLITTDAMTPGEARRRGAGVTLEYGVAASPFGPAFMAWNPRGLAFLGFTGEGGKRCLGELADQWPDANLRENCALAGRWVETIFSRSRDEPLKLWLRGSPFQLKVWEALLAVPAGRHASYQAIARRIDKPRASRAVGTAVGRNPISWLIPCHRVITSAGGLGGYRWGLETKQAMIGVEAGWNPINDQAADSSRSKTSAMRSAASEGGGTEVGFSPR